LEGELHVGRGEARAVVPGDTVTQPEAIDGAALLDRPALGQVRCGIAACVAAEQAVVDQLCGRVGGAAGRDRRVEVAGVGVDGDDQRASARRAVLGLRPCRDCPRDGEDGEEQYDGPEEYTHIGLSWARFSFSNVIREIEVSPTYRAGATGPVDALCGRQRRPGRAQGPRPMLCGPASAGRAAGSP